MKNFKIAAALIAALMLTGLAGCASGPTTASTGQYVDDTVLTANVKAAIFNEPSLKVSEINVETFKGTVQLSGFVRSHDNVQTAMKIARDVKGVQAVKNDMRVK